MQSVNVDDLVGDDWERKYINRLQRQELVIISSNYYLVQKT